MERAVGLSAVTLAEGVPHAPVVPGEPAAWEAAEAAAVAAAEEVVAEAAGMVVAEEAAAIEVFQLEMPNLNTI